MARVVRAAFAAALCLAVADASSSAATVTPVEKVIELLGDMMAKCSEEKTAEAVEYAKFNQFCIDTIAEKEKKIAFWTRTVEVLAAQIEKYEADAKKLSKEIDELNAQIASNDADLKAEKAQREKDHAAYLENVADLGECIEALTKAIAVLKKQDYDRTQAAAVLLQLSSSAALPDTARRTVTAFIELTAQGPLRDSEGYMDRDAPQANAYEFQSGGIVDLLKKLLKEMKAEKDKAEEEEMNSKHAAYMIIQDLTDTIKRAEQDVALKTEDLQECKTGAAESKTQLTTAQKSLEADSAYLADLKVECTEKGKSFDEKQELREGEIKALQEAMKILKSEAVSGNAEKHLPTLVQQAASGPALAQLRAAGAERRAAESPFRLQVANFLEGEGERLHSQVLGLLGQKMASDPFAKVKQMIQDLIEKLLAETNAETEAKGFCDKEVGTNKITREKLTADTEDLTAQIDDTTARISQIEDDLGTLTKEISELNAAMAEATELRNAEKAKNQATITDAKEAQEAVQMATQIIKDFYERAAESTALVQTGARAQTAHRGAPVKMGSPEWEALANPNVKLDPGHREGMQTFGETYKGNTDAAGGVLAMLEVIFGQFASLEAETKADEAEAQKLYQDFMAESEKSVAVKEKQTELLTADKTTSQANLISAKKDLSETTDELLAANRYYDKLKPQCVDTGITYEERAQRRAAEIQSLQEALTILSGEGI